MTKAVGLAEDEDFGAEEDQEFDTSEAGGSVFPQGKFIFNTLSAERRQNKKGEPQLMVKFGVTDTIECEEDVAEGRVFVEFFALVGNAKFKTAMLGKGLGFEGKFKTSDIIEAVENGSTVKMTIAHREWDGRVFSQAKSIEPVESAVKPAATKTAPKGAAQKPKA